MKTIAQYNGQLLKAEEMADLKGGKAAELIGLGIASGLLASFFGPLGMAYAYYNYFKD